MEVDILYRVRAGELMPIPRVYVEEACPLEGYEGLKVRLLANATDAEWRAWLGGTLGAVGCEACKALNTPAAPTPQERRYCSDCTAAREAQGRSIVLFYGPRVLDEDVSTPAAALALFDDDDRLPSEIVIWLTILPGVVRNARLDRLLPNSNGSLTTPTT